MGCISVCQQRSQLTGLLRIVLGTVHHLIKLIQFNETYSIGYYRQPIQHIAKELNVVVVGMEHRTLLWCGCQVHNGPAHFVDGRELHLAGSHRIRTAAKHVEYTDTSHERVGGEVGLELTIGRACCQIAYAHDLTIEPVEGNRLEDQAFGHELRVDILVVQILANIESLLREHLILRFTSPDTTGAGGRDMDETGTRLDTVLHAMLGTTDVHVLYLCAFTEVLHDSCTIEDSINLQTYSEVAGDVAQNNMETCTKEWCKRFVEIIVEHGVKTVLCRLNRLASNQTVDILGI